MERNKRMVNELEPSHSLYFGGTPLELKSKAFTLAEGAKVGFTLAEVLITLGIIGVVAAMTIPNLIANTKSARYRSQYKKAVSTLTQAVRMNKANYDWDFADIGETCPSTDFMSHTSDTKSSICAIFNSNLSGIQGIYRNQDLTTKYNYSFKASSLPAWANNQYTIYILKDGTIVGVRSGVKPSCSLPVGVNIGKALLEETTLEAPKFYSCSGFIDVNGLSLPNTEVKCSTGTISRDVDEPCTVKNKDLTDVFPVVFYNDTVSPASNASRYVLQTAK